MDKQKVQDPLTFKADECRNCQFVWLDGGELAKIQIAYEANAQTLEIRKMQTRLANLTPDERAAYEARIAKLVDRGGPLADATRQATIELTFWYYWLGIH
jgi:Zn-finger nucleic acid-binding protein